MARDDRVTDPSGRRVPEVDLPSEPWRPGRGPPPRGTDPTPTDRLLHRGADLFDAGYWWEAHEVWEAHWVTCPMGSPERDLAQGLIQAAASLIKRRDGVRSAQARLERRALERLERAVAAGGPVQHGLDVGRFLDDLRALGPDDPPPTLHPG